MKKSTLKKLVNEVVNKLDNICPMHKTPNGKMTNMCPTDDDYEINYGVKKENLYLTHKNPMLYGLQRLKAYSSWGVAHADKISYEEIKGIFEKIDNEVNGLIEMSSKKK